MKIIKLTLLAVLIASWCYPAAQVSAQSAPQLDTSHRTLLTPICQEVTDRFLTLRHQLDIETVKLPETLASIPNRFEAIATYATTLILAEYPEYTTRDIADMLLCRFAMSPDRCPRKEFLQSPPR